MRFRQLGHSEYYVSDAVLPESAWCPAYAVRRNGLGQWHAIAEDEGIIMAIIDEDPADGILADFRARRKAEKVCAEDYEEQQRRDETPIAELILEPAWWVS